MSQSSSRVIFQGSDDIGADSQILEADNFTVGSSHLRNTRVDLEWALNTLKIMIERVQTLESSITSQKDDVKKVRDDLKDTKVELQEARGKVVESITIFASLFTIVSVGFQLFSQSMEAGLAIAVLLILSGVLSLFVLLVHLLMRPRTPAHPISQEEINNMNVPLFWKIFKRKIFFIFFNETTVTVLFLISIVLISLGYTLSVGYRNKMINSQNIEIYIPVEQPDRFQQVKEKP